MESNKKIINIVILYGNESEVLEYAISLSRQTTSRDIKLVIVVNKMSEYGFEKFNEELKSIDLITYVYLPNKNLGYLNGLIYGYKKFIIENKVYDWIVFSNTDILFSDNTFFEKFNNSKFENDIWLIGPSIFSLDTNSFENPQYKKRLSLKSINRKVKIFSNVLISSIYYKLSIMKSKIKKNKKEESQYVYTVHGCFFFLKSDFMNILENFNYGPLIYGEEICLAELVRQNNKKCYYDSKIQVTHKGSTVTSLLNIKKKNNYIIDSLEYIKMMFY